MCEGVMKVREQMSRWIRTLSGVVAVMAAISPPVEARQSPEQPQVVVEGPYLRITTSSAPGTVFRDETILGGTFSVKADFVSVDATPATAYGVVVGGRSATALACIVREDGAFNFSRGAASSGPSEWTATGTSAARTRPDRISIHVTGTTATCAMNGRDLKTRTIGTGDADGPAGLFIGAATHVTVSGFTTEAAGPRVLTIGG
jgi:hypothetical protein